ncbi:hypothetical protein BC831DRAFT_547637 [Entophlyctis helioformis]|nr:hypothetical protein BC831DRAFT_547637 [Entophlyctis helioformis]
MISEIEQACAQSLGSLDASARQFAQASLAAFFPSLSSTSKDAAALPQASIPLEDLIRINTTVLHRIAQTSILADRASLIMLCGISAEVTVLGWSQAEEVFANALFPTDGSSFPRLAWVLLLQSVTMEMNQEKSVLKGFPKHRKTGGPNDFGTNTNAIGVSTPATSLPRDLLALLTECLAFDFIGINPDESYDDQGSVHIPSTWKEDIQDQKLLMALCTSLGIVPDCQAQILECMSFIFCARRSLFSDAERDQFTSTNLEVLRAALKFFAQLSDDGRHRFYRLVARFFSVYASDVLRSPTGEPFIREFTVQSISSISEWSDLEMSHLVQTWHKIADGCGNTKSDLSIKYRDCILSVAQALIGYDGSNLDFEDDDAEMLYQIIESCATIVRYDYATVADMLADRFKASVDAYLHSGGGGISPGGKRRSGSGGFVAPSDQAIMSYYQSPEDHDVLDGRLAGLLFEFASVDLMNTATQASHVQRFDGIMAFAFLKLTMILGNLRFASSSRVIERTIEAFTEFTSGTYTSKMLKRSQVIVFLVENHSSESFARITEAKQLQQVVFAGITRLLILESDESFDKELFIFLAPLQNELDALKSLADGDLLVPAVRSSVSRLFRKLRQRFAILAHPTHDNVAALRFFDEFVLNKNNRLNYDINSASGNTLKNALGGRYVCFGVFSLYSDPVLNNTLAVMFGLSRFIEPRYLLEFPKLGNAYLGLWGTFTSEQMPLAEEFDLDTFRHLLECCHTALHAADILFLLVVDYVGALTRHIRGKAPDLVYTRVQQTSSQCQTLLATLFDKVVNEDVANQWSMSRPLLPLILLFSEFFQTYAEQMINEQRPQYQEPFGKARLAAWHQCAVMLVMDGVTISLESKNRDRFTTNVSNVRRRVATEASSPV